MAAITSFDKVTLRALRPEIESALAAVAAHYGIAITVGSASYSGTNASFKLELAAKTDAGEVITKEAAAFTQYASLYEMKPEWLGQTFELAGRTMKVTGLRLNAPKRSVLIADAASGKAFVTTADSLRAAMQRKGL